MRSGVFITGTDTEVGKTFISSLLVKGLRDYGVDAGYFKSVLSGGFYENGKLVPKDAKEVCEISGLKEDYENMVSYVLKNPYSPHLAAHVEDVDINIEKIINDYRNMMDKYEFLIVEGSGGVFCPIKIEGDEILFSDDVIKNLGLSTILVTRAGIGTLNHTALTVEHLRDIGVDIRGIIINGYNENDIMHRSNKEVIEKLTGIKNICTVPDMDKSNINDGVMMNLVSVLNKASLQ
ncbi:dethiobiotin synthase [Eubacterium multiforme]|uniref:dethiobiotin synthase n=1 Tax=Eubacterium multiforme TaxID=83339 RepID=UPI0027D823EC|nr:dethiobiotin synthase [Eubacterium multiforme]